MSFETYGDVKSYAMQMLSEEETETVFSQRLLPRWARQIRDRINEYHNWSWKEGLIRLTWPGVASREVAAVLYLPEDVGQILSMYPNNLSYREPVRIMDRWEFDQLRPGNTIGRGIDYLVQYGYYRVMVDNPSDAQLTVRATGTAADLTGLKAKIKGRDTNNDDIEEIIEFDGSGQTETTTTTFLGGPGLDGVRSFELESESVNTILNNNLSIGTVTLENSGVILERLAADQRQLARERKRTELYAQIGGPGTYQIAYYRRLRPFVSDLDSFMPELPNEFSDCIELGIMKHIAMFRQDWNAVGLIKMEWATRMRELVAWTNRAPGMKRRLMVNRQWGTRTNRR